MQDALVDTVRRFNRFYTRRIGVLGPRLYESPYSLAEVRVLYELAHAAGPVTATALTDSLAIDAGYLSRILRGFVARGLVRRRRSARDGREQLVALTAAGRRALAPLERASQDEVRSLIAPLGVDGGARLASAMDTIEALLRDGGRAPSAADASLASSPDAPSASTGQRAPGQAFTLRAHRPGDIGWVVSRHGALYAQEYGWDITFEAMVAEIAAKFLRRFDARTERCFIAERDGANVGCAFVVRRSAKTAQLRMLLVEPSARGFGIGAALVDACLAFARTAGYRKMMLWTNAGLDAARHLYDGRGFRVVREESHRSFGHDLVGQTLEIDLQARERG